MEFTGKIVGKYSSSQDESVNGFDLFFYMRMSEVDWWVLDLPDERTKYLKLKINQSINKLRGNLFIELGEKYCPDTT